MLDYLDKNWNAAVAIKFLDRLETLISVISGHPERHPMINDELGIRKQEVGNRKL